MAFTPATLLVFTLGPSRERERRRLLPASAAAEEQALYAGCLGAALEAGLEAGCSVVVSTPERLALPPRIVQHRQPNGDFAARLGQAMTRARQAYPGPLVVVGTDVPGLLAAHLETALDALTGGPRRAVLGPSPDGGFYLLAIDEPIPELLAQVRWSHPRTQADLAGALRRAGFEVVLLPPLRDLDRRSDLERLLAGRSPALGTLGRSLVARLATVLAALKAVFLGPAERPRLLLEVPLLPGRAPPLPR
ncbi:MAG TPA: DUF2064 domain-containing protein [Thermoanaerobaculia bacterium]|nr:DUF2064 domain-containing protein [Thermoanaerobaculia bacterium]